MGGRFLIHGKVKQVGNSIAIFVSAEERDKYNLVPGAEVELELTRKKVVKSLFGILKGKKFEPFTRADRMDFHGE
ncbi:MAG: hypothetical protein V1644_03885 [Candidatus Micrarchaeota archaeon]